MEPETLLDPINVVLLEKLSPQGAAERIEFEFGEDIIFNGTNFYQWISESWQRIEDIDIDRMALHMLKTPNRSNAADFRWLLATQFHQGVNQNPLAVQLVNGVFDLDAMAVKPSEDYKTSYLIGRLPIEYNPAAECENWLKFLNEVMQGDAEKIRLIREFFGYCLLGDNRYQQALVLLGAGNNGKSVLLEILQSLFDKVTYLDLKQIEDERYVHHLQDSWLNVASELAYKSVETTATIKAVIAGETIQAAPKYHKGFSFRPRAKVAFATNGLPRNNDTSQGYFRRLLIINMAHRVSNPNPHLVRELKKEKSGIFNWMVDGLRDLLKRGSFNYTNPYLELYKEESSSLYSWWVEEGQNWMKDPIDFRNAAGKEIGFADIVYNDQKHVYFSAFFQHYERYCSRGGMRASGRNKLRSECERLQLPLEFYVGHGNTKIIRIMVTDLVTDFKVSNHEERNNLQDNGEAPF